MTQRYLDWIMSNLLGRTTNAPILPTTPVAPPMPGQPAQETSVAPQDTFSVGRIGSFADLVPGEMSDVVRQAMMERNLGLIAPPDLSKVKSEDVPGYLQQVLGVGQYPLNNYNREYLSGLNSVLEKMQKFSVDPVTGELISRYRLQWEDALAQNPGDPMAQKVILAMEDVKNGVSANDVIDKNPDFNDTIQNAIKQYAKDTAELADLNFSLVSFAANEGLPLPTEQWQVDPNAIAKMVFAKTSGPDAGKTDYQIAMDTLQRAQSEYEPTREFYVPKDRTQIEAALLQGENKQQLKQDSFYNASRQRKASSAAANAARQEFATSGNADRAATAAQIAAEQKMNESSKFAPSRISSTKQKAMQQKIEEQVWNEGYKAMRGAKTGGDVRLRSEVARAEQQAYLAKQQQDEFAQAVAEEITRKYGTPLEAALKQARAVINANSKELEPVFNPLSQYPFNTR